MKTFDCLTLHNLFEENIDFFIGARLQKIQQPTRRDFVLSLRNNGKSRKFYINIHPDNYHVCFMSSDNETKRHFNIPKHPPMFCMLLRKYLEGGRISDTCAIENERILEFHFETTDELSEERFLCLAIELMGKHSNVILYNRKTGIIIGCAHNIGAEKSRYRELHGGLKYIYPPTTAIPPLKPNFENEKDLSLNSVVDNYYATIQEKQIIKNCKLKLAALVNPKIKKNKNSMEKINLLLKKRDNTEKYKLYGEILTANLYKKLDFQKEIELFDYTNNRNITIELDTTKTLNENAQRYFNLYTKSKNTKEKSTKILEELTVEREYLENLLYSIERAENLEDLEEIQTELNPKECKNLKQTHSGLIKLKIKEFDVFIGRNNKQNDYIVSKLAKDNDYWFHTKQCAGSHVLLKTAGNEPNEDVLYECCKLARKYSSAVQPSKIGIIYTRAANLRKPPAAPLGYVTYKNEKEVLI